MASMSILVRSGKVNVKNKVSLLLLVFGFVILHPLFFLKNTIIPINLCLCLSKLSFRSSRWGSMGIWQSELNEKKKLSFVVSSFICQDLCRVYWMKLCLGC